MLVLKILNKIRVLVEDEPPALKIVDSLITAVKDTGASKGIEDEDEAWEQVENDLSFFTLEHLLNARKAQGLALDGQSLSDMKEAAEAAKRLTQLIHSVRHPV